MGRWFSCCLEDSGMSESDGWGGKARKRRKGKKRHIFPLFTFFLGSDSVGKRHVTRDDGIYSNKATKMKKHGATTQSENERNKMDVMYIVSHRLTSRRRPREAVNRGCAALRAPWI